MIHGLVLRARHGRVHGEKENTEKCYCEKRLRGKFPKRNVHGLCRPRAFGYDKNAGKLLQTFKGNLRTALSEQEGAATLPQVKRRRLQALDSDGREKATSLFKRIQKPDCGTQMKKIQS
jgi:hypothetical protein